MAKSFPQADSLEKSKRGRSSRRRGQVGEREFLKLLQSLLADRGLSLTLQRNYDQTAVGGADCVGIPELAIEVKRHETLSIPGWWRQAINQADKLGRIPVLAYRQNRHPWTILLPASLAPNAEILSFQTRSGLPPAAIVTPEYLTDWYCAKLKAAG
jgi:hypothetical protein